MDFEYIIDKSHWILIENNMKNSMELDSIFLPFKMLHQIYQLFPVDNCMPTFSNTEFICSSQEIIFRGNPKHRLKKWLDDIQEPEFVYHLYKSRNVDKLGSGLRFGHGYYFTNNMEYVKIHLSQSHHDCKFNGDESDYIIKAKVKDSTNFIDYRNLDSALDELLPQVNHFKNIEIKYSNTKDQKLNILVHLFRHVHHQSLSSLLLGYDGFTIERNSSSKFDRPIFRTEYVITNRNKLIFEEPLIMECIEQETMQLNIKI